MTGQATPFLTSAALQLLLVTITFMTDDFERRNYYRAAQED